MLNIWNDMWGINRGKEGGDRISHKGVREWLHIIDLTRLQSYYTIFPEAQTK